MAGDLGHSEFWEGLYGGENKILDTISDLQGHVIDDKDKAIIKSIFNGFDATVEFLVRNGWRMSKSGVTGGLAFV